jgi:peptide deformylase
MDMVRELMHDPLFLGRKSRAATKEDLPIGQDLLETLLAHRATCVGMAGNMIGETVAVIAFFDGDKPMVMYNPEILKAEGEYQTEEGCLSLLGGPRKCTRYQKIKVRWDNEQFQKRVKTFTGWTAQIIQHEVDHCKGILI